MILRITIEEHAELQKRIWAVLNAGYHTARGESSLFDITVVILGILVQYEFSEFLQLDCKLAPSET